MAKAQALDLDLVSDPSFITSFMTIIKLLNVCKHHFIYKTKVIIFTTGCKDE